MPAEGGSNNVLSPYRVVDATDHRGQLAGFVLAGLGADVVRAEPPGGHPARDRGDGLEWWAYNRGKSSVVCTAHDDLLALAADADVLLDSGPPGYEHDELIARNPRLVHVTVSPFGLDGPKAGWAASDLTVLAAGCAQVLNGDSDRPPVRTSVPQAWLHAGAEAAVGALLALTERERSGLGQHVDVSAQQAVLQAGIPGVLLAPNANPEARRTAGGILLGDLHLQFVYPALDGHVSITLLFGTMIGPFSRRLVEWVHEEGHCDRAMVGWDWEAFGVRLVTTPEGPGELEQVKAAITALTSSKTKAELFAEAQRRRLLLAPVATAAELVADAHLADRGYWTTVDGRIAPGAFVRSSLGAVQVPGAPPAVGERDAPPWRPRPRAASAAAPASTATGALRALDGLKVVDLTWVFAGPLTTRVLAEHGATVVKVEGPGHPDASRSGGGALNGDLGIEGSIAFAHFNADKLSVTLDLTNPAGRDVLRDLVRWADVLMESYTPGVMARWQLSYDDLREINPELIMMSTSLMGQTGPLRDFAGFGNLAGAISGFYELTGWPDRSPAGPFLAYTDYVAPRFAAASLLAALDLRRRTGCGQHLDLAQAEASIHFLAPAVLDHTVNGNHPTRQGNADLWASPHGVYRCAGDDAWVAIACETGAQREALAAAIGVAGSPSDGDVGAWTSTRQIADVEQVLQAVGVPVHGVQNSAACYADPQLQHRSHYVDVPHPVHGSCVIEGPRLRLSRTPGFVRRANPSMGEHNDTVLGDLLGYDAARITDLVIEGALG
ncbi:MAG: CoA transferase [Ilumatobacteraceae bacterium]